MGFPYGADEDAAFMIAWLELHKLGGIQKLTELLNQINQKFNAKINLDDLKSKKSINLYKISLLMKGPSLFDYLYEETKKNQYLEITLENCIDPIFIIPLGNEKVCMDISKNKILIGKLENNIEILDGQVILKFSKNDFRKSYEKSILKINNIKREINNDVEQKYLKESLNPNPIHWDIISKLAHLTFVPASDESRNLGAGGGNDND